MSTRLYDTDLNDAASRLGRPVPASRKIGVLPTKVRKTPRDSTKAMICTMMGPFCVLRKSNARSDGRFWGLDSDRILDLFVRESVFAQRINMLAEHDRAIGDNAGQALPVLFFLGLDGSRLTTACSRARVGGRRLKLTPALGKSGDGVVQPQKRRADPALFHVSCW
jgi:hypothetical protein